MCSVIEIKNANEYYIHYHSPESLPNGNNIPEGGTDPKTNSKKSTMEEEKNDKNSNENETKLKESKNQEITSDRGSSASPSLEDEDEQINNKKEVIEEKTDHKNKQTKSNSSSPTKESRIPVRTNNKKLQAPQPPPKPSINNNNKKYSTKKSSAPKPPLSGLDSKNPFLNNEENEVGHYTGNSSDKKSKVPGSKKSSQLPRRSPPRSQSAGSKLTSARSLESVPITVNSHIPASPLRPSSAILHKKVTSEMGTQVEAAASKVTKSVSVDNLASPAKKGLLKANKTEEPSLFSKKVSSESADPICSTQQQVKKWSYTNGRPHRDRKNLLHNAYIQIQPK